MNNNKYLINNKVSCHDFARAQTILRRSQTPLIQQTWCGEYIWVINRTAVARKDEKRFANCFSPTVQLELFANYQHTYGCFVDIDFDGLI